jgi:hypothetical protein
VLPLVLTLLLSLQYRLRPGHLALLLVLLLVPLLLQVVEG